MSRNRRRLGVALLLDPPLAYEIDGLRRAVGDPSLARIPPHVTLVPPVNVPTSELPSALSRLRSAAAGQHGPMQLTLGAVTTFLPDNPVLYLAVGGELDRLRLLRDAVFGPPLERHLSWPWVPHLTLADGAEPERMAAAVAALADYAAVADVDRVVLLEENPGRVWAPLADAAFGRPARVGTGGLPLELTLGRLVDPELASSISCPPAGVDQDTVAADRFAGSSRDRIVITARHHGRPVGAAVAWADRAGAHVAVWVLPDRRRQGVGSHLLAHLESTARREGWRDPVLVAVGPSAFYTARSAWSRPL